MRRAARRLGALAGMMVVLLGTAAPPPEAGWWLTQNGSSVIAIERCGDGLCGRLVGVTKTDTGGMPIRDVWGRPVCNETIIHMDRFGSDLRWHGTILDPRNGAVYSAEVWRLGADLRLRGYLGVPLLGKTELWRAFQGTALPDCRFTLTAAAKP